MACETGSNAGSEIAEGLKRDNAALRAEADSAAASATQWRTEAKALKAEVARLRGVLRMLQERADDEIHITQEAVWAVIKTALNGDAP